MAKDLIFFPLFLLQVSLYEIYVLSSQFAFFLSSYPHVYVSKPDRGMMKEILNQQYCLYVFVQPIFFINLNVSLRFFSSVYVRGRMIYIR